MTDLSEYLPSRDVLSKLYTRRGIIRTFFPAGKSGGKKGLYYDLLIIDDRSHMFRLRHSVLTVYYGTRAIGFCDMTSPHIFPDFRISCFGSKNERNHSNTHSLNSDKDGIPEKELRLGHPNYGQEGYLIENQFKLLPISKAIIQLNVDVLNLYHLNEKSNNRHKLALLTGDVQIQKYIFG